MKQELFTLGSSYNSRSSTETLLSPHHHSQAKRRGEKSAFTGFTAYLALQDRDGEYHFIDQETEARRVRVLPRATEWGFEPDLSGS